VPDIILGYHITVPGQFKEVIDCPDRSMLRLLASPQMAE
jgi:hypothetical protein